MGRRRCGRVLLAALPRRGDRLAGPAGLACARLAARIAARAERSPRGRGVGGAIRGPRRRVGDARRGRRLRATRGLPLPHSASSRPQRAQRRRGARADGGRPGRPALRPNSCDCLGRRGRRARMAREGRRRRALPARLAGVPRRGARPRGLHRCASDAALRTRLEPGRRRRRDRRGRVGGLDRRLVLPALGRDGAGARRVRPPRARPVRVPRDARPNGGRRSRRRARSRRSTPPRSPCSVWRSGCRRAPLGLPSSGVTSRSPGSGASRRSPCSRSGTGSGGPTFEQPASSGWAPCCCETVLFVGAELDGSQRGYAFLIGAAALLVGALVDRLSMRDAVGLVCAGSGAVASMALAVAGLFELVDGGADGELRPPRSRRALRRPRRTRFLARP